MTSRRARPRADRAVGVVMPLGHAWVDRAIDAIALTLVAALPSFLNLSTVRIFEEEKALLVRAGALVLLPAVVWRWRALRDASLWRQPVVVTFVCFLGALFLASALGVAPGEAFSGAYVRLHGFFTWLALGVLFAALLLSCARDGGVDRLLTGVALGSVWPAVYAVLQATGVDPIEWTDAAAHRSGSTFGNPILFGGYLAAVIPLTCALARRRTFWIALVPLQVIALLASGSRGPLLGLVAGAGVFAAVALWQRARAVVITAIVMAAAAGSALAIWPSLRPAPLQTLVESRAGSGRVRVLIWNGVARIMERSGARLAIGFGPESLHRMFPPHYVPEIGRIEQTEAMPDRAHNELLDTLVSAGALGVVAELLFWGALFAAAVSGPDRWFAAAIAGSIAAHVVELQFGIATVASRSVLLAAAAITVAARMQSEAATKHATPAPSHVDRQSMWVALAAAAGALAMPLSIKAPATSVAAAIYGACALAAAAVIWRFNAGVARTSWLPFAALGVAAAATWAAAVRPSAADTAARAGQALDRDQRPAEAAAMFREALRRQPDQEPYLTSLGRTLLQTRDYTGARDVLERAMHRNPADPQHHRNLASVHRVQARDEPGAARDASLVEADRLYAVATTLAPGLPALWEEWANVDAERRRLPEARQKLARAIALDDSRYESWLLSGIVRTLQRDSAGAIADLDRALRLKPGDAGVLRRRAAAYIAAGRLDEARRDLDAVLLANPGDDAAARLRARLQ